MGGKLAGIHLSPAAKSAQKQGHPLHETSIHCQLSAEQL